MTRVAIAGFGAIGRELAMHLAAVPGVELVAVSARDEHRAAETLRSLGLQAPVVPFDELEPLADLVVEWAPAALLREIATPFLQAGKEVIVLKIGRAHV